MGQTLNELQSSVYENLDLNNNPYIPGVYKFNPPDGARIPIHIISEDLNFGEPSTLKNFRYVEFHGSGIAICRLFADDIFRVEGTAILSENPTKSRKIALPRGICGYTLRFELYGHFIFNFAECTFDLR